ncbi:glycosyltransferase family 4 protein [Candidatus Magnetominusculus xianensis]|uniref:Glycosyl transferase family n=1 Tax=Candidatus Magnetominusculus xianensis TaxID=1748249 RepID=A0ABR5SEN7_9BACT|nr:glycosyltransferase family 4 protein [Candidatus Magnetominusculus xianensis]KWT84954.1 glycosyl transferase family [Candidatus Magnetominusculus xianensis]MBF0404465.1 glycosyltransferase family 4 protein [Nitrospirota bacterium]
MKIAFVATSAANIYLFKRKWIKALAAEGHDVYAVVPEDSFTDKLKDEKIQMISYNIVRGSLNPLTEIATFMELLRIFMKERFDVVHTFSHKPNIYGTIAAKLCRVGIVVNHIEGLGYIYTENNLKTIGLRYMLSVFYRISSKIIDRIVLSNYEERKAFENIMPLEKVVVVRGAGVDVNYFSAENVNITVSNELKLQYSITDESIVIMIIARLLYHKGIREFVEAANELSRQRDGLLFLVVGGVDRENPSYVTEDFINETSKNKSIIFLGERFDVREILSLSHIFVLPSYREGTSQTILEAMSMGKPIITTETPGCSHTVDHMVTGIKILPKDTKSLVSALELLIDNRSLRESMGAASRQKTVSEFSSDIIISEILKVYKELYK